MVRHCSHCGGIGHNRRTCGDLSEDDREYENRNRRVNTTRTCSFCRAIRSAHRSTARPALELYVASKHAKHDLDQILSVHGRVGHFVIKEFGRTHNKRTCPIRKAVVDDRAEKECEAWSKIFKELTEKGLGYGTMIMSRSYDRDEGEYVDCRGWIVGANWDPSKNAEPTFKCQHLNPKYDPRDLSWAWTRRALSVGDWVTPVEAAKRAVVVGSKPIEMPDRFKSADHPFFRARANDYVNSYYDM